MSESGVGINFSTESERDIRTYLSKYFVPETVQFLVHTYDLRTLNTFVIAIGDPQIDWMLESNKITRYEAGTLKMLIRMCKINDLLQELNKTY